MGTLYRTPNIVIDEFEFHVAVELREDGRVRRYTRFRPLIDRHKTPWASITSFPGHLPKSLSTKLNPFKRHMAQAEKSVAENRRASKALQAKRAARIAERMAA